MNIPQRRKQLLAVVLGVAFSIPAVSTAGTMPLEKNVNSVTVSFADLNLSNDSGVETLYQRLKTASHRSCGTVSARQLNLFRPIKECVKKALAEAVDSIDNEKLDQLHSS